MDEDFLDELKRKEEGLQKRLRWLREEGEDTPSARNHIIADNEVLWEIGKYGEGARREGDKIPDDVLQGLIIRMRRDALAAKLNTAQILDLLTKARS